ncbi:unnamed protein product [Didymodactylos carnosus]|uniref:Uncharacterized protein n=1 Tax=Didymodactylos carnosus TaxID=1234261 RepID=A0A8S2I9W8_9BILA|nr:unnamed protein product [Didymodactylos carnosus]CAF3706007.1 unnamed protein product [Didymodactylos carnosus]
MIPNANLLMVMMKFDHYIVIQNTKQCYAVPITVLVIVHGPRCHFVHNEMDSVILQDSASTKSAMSSNDGVNYGVFSSSMSSHSISPRSISPSNSPTTSASSECGSDDDSSITGYRQHSHQLQQPSQYTRIHSDSSSIDDYTYYHVSLN